MDVRFFLGANSGVGFYSLYDGFCAGRGDFLNLIKAGPGGGKSRFMREIASAAAQRGYDTQCILCSGDPSSLDAVYIPALRLGYMDATAPHALEPRCFAQNSRYVNLGEFCKSFCDPRTEPLMQKYRSEYNAAYAYLSAAASVEKVGASEVITPDIITKTRRRARSAAQRELGKGQQGEGSVAYRFISCISCEGKLTLTDSINKLCKRIYVLDDRCFLAREYLDELLCEAKRRQESVIACPSALLPDTLEALLLPQRSLGFVSRRVMQPESAWRHVRLDALVPRESAREARGALRKNESIRRELTLEALRLLARAKEHHDELERVYNPHVDFAALDAFCEAEIARIFA